MILTCNNNNLVNGLFQCLYSEFKMKDMGEDIIYLVFMFLIMPNDDF